MAEHPIEGATSTAAINGHPIHPMLVPFPIAFLVGALVSDIVFWAGADPFWGEASLWLIGAGFVMGALAAVAGLIDFITIARARVGATGWVHFLGNAVALVCALINLILRIGHPTQPIIPGGLILSIATVAIFLVTGWLGGELVFRHRIGVIEENASAEWAKVNRAYAGDRPRQ